MAYRSLVAAVLVTIGSAIMSIPAFPTDKPSAGSGAKTFSAFVEQVFNQGQIEKSDLYFAPDFIDHAPWPGKSADVAGFKAGLAEMRSAFPDLKVTIERTVSEGDLVVVHMTMSGTHRGDYMGAKPSGKTFKVEAIDIVRVKNGRFTEHWGIFDAAMMAQLGL
jgi:steroid delta-isomerase-like uncharacterized protein